MPNSTPGSHDPVSLTASPSVHDASPSADPVFLTASPSSAPSSAGSSLPKASSRGHGHVSRKRSVHFDVDPLSAVSDIASKPKKSIYTYRGSSRPVSSRDDFGLLDDDEADPSTPDYRHSRKNDDGYDFDGDESDLAFLAEQDPLTSSLPSTRPTRFAPMQIDDRFSDSSSAADPILPTGTDPSLPPTDAGYLHQDTTKSSLLAAFMNMANSIIGAGIIGQPYALRQAGLLTGCVLLVALTFVVDWTIRLLVVNSKLSGQTTFQGTVRHCFGWPGFVAISLTQWSFAFGGMVAFCVVIGDSIPPVLRLLLPASAPSWVMALTDRRLVIVVCTLGVSFPLSLYRDIAKLAKASTIAFFSMVIIVVTVVVQGLFFVQPEDRGSFPWSTLTISPGLFQAIGVISFAFVCHHNSLLIYGSLDRPTMDRFATVTHYSTGVSMVACLVMALAGFLTFGDKTMGNVLNNFPADNVMVTVTRLFFGFNMVTTIPLEAFVCREVMVGMKDFSPTDPQSARPTEPSTVWHAGATSFIVLGAMSVSLMTCDLGVVFELVGSTSACCLAYILPPLCYLQLTTPLAPPSPSRPASILHARQVEEAEGLLAASSPSLLVSSSADPSADEPYPGQRIPPPPTTVAPSTYGRPVWKLLWHRHTSSTSWLAVGVTVFGIVVMLLSIVDAVSSIIWGKEGAQCT